MISAKHEEETREQFKQRCLNDTGFLARWVLGYNYDKDPDTNVDINVGSGGIRDSGPHKEMVDFIDRPSQLKLLLCSRGSLKTTLAQAYVVRRILKDPNISIRFGRETYTNALESIGAVKELLETEKLVELFGAQRGKALWKSEKFRVAACQRAGRADVTVSGFGTDKVITGGHADLIVWDDPIGWLAARSSDLLEKALACFRQLQPILNPGGTFLVVMTPYDESDLSHHIRNELRGWDVLKLDCGMKPVGDQGSGYDLVGEPRFPHLPKKVLMQKLDGMGVADFTAQYCLEVTNPADQTYYRHHFRYERFDKDRHPFMASYFLTDTAVSDHDKACMSVVALVAIDPDDRSYLVDLAVGFWRVEAFCSAFCDMYERWDNQVRIYGICMENIAINKGIRATLDQEAARRKLRMHFKEIPRGVSDNDKDRRIRMLEPRFLSGRFTVLDTVPRTFTHQGKTKLLFDPEGFKTAGGQPQPAGELVDQFIRWRWSGSAALKDIPDALADLEATDARGMRYCQPPCKQQWEDQQVGQQKRRGMGPRPYLHSSNRRSDFWADAHRRIPRA